MKDKLLFKTLLNPHPLTVQKLTDPNFYQNTFGDKWSQKQAYKEEHDLQAKIGYIVENFQKNAIFGEEENYEDAPKKLFSDYEDFSSEYKFIRS